MVPEAPMHEKNRTVFRKDHIRFSGKAFFMQTISETHGKEPPSHLYFEFRIPCPNGRHHSASCLLIHRVHQSRLSDAFLMIFTEACALLSSIQLPHIIPRWSVRYLPRQAVRPRHCAARMDRSLQPTNPRCGFAPWLRQICRPGSRWPETP